MALEKNQRIIDRLFASGADPNAELRNILTKSNGICNPYTAVGIMNKYQSYAEATCPYNSAVISFLQLPKLRHLNGLLLEACSLGLAECFDALLDRGADILARDPSGCNALHALAGHRNDSALEAKSWDKLLQQPELVNGASNNGSYPVHGAVIKHTSFAMRLIAAGADPWVVDGDGQNILHIVSETGNAALSVSTFEELLPLPGAAAALHVKSNDDEQSTPVERLFGSGRYRLSCREDPDEDRFWKEKDKCVFDMVEAAGADLHTLNNMGQSLLHLTARTQSALAFQYLLDRGLDPRLEDKMQRTPLDVAAGCDAERILKLFK